MIQGFYAGQCAYRQQLLAMGLVPGVLFTLVRIAPLGDPVEINVRGFSLVLRQQEASVLKVTQPALEQSA
jgi:ferrous iron transport protein A